MQIAFPKSLKPDLICRCSTVTTKQEEGKAGIIWPIIGSVLEPMQRVDDKKCLAVFWNRWALESSVGKGLNSSETVLKCRCSTVTSKLEEGQTESRWPIIGCVLEPMQRADGQEMIGCGMKAMGVGCLKGGIAQLLTASVLSCNPNADIDAILLRLS